MTFEECVKILPDELKALGYKMSHRTYYIGDNATNFHLDDDCNDCLLRIVDSATKGRKCICYAKNIHSTDWNTCYYKDFNDISYETIMTAARNLVAQYKKYNIELKIDELSKDFV